MNMNRNFKREKNTYKELFFLIYLSLNLNDIMDKYNLCNVVNYGHSEIGWWSMKFEHVRNNNHWL